MVSAARKEEVRIVPPSRKHNQIKRKPVNRTDAILRARGRLATGLIVAVTLLLMFATVGRYAELSDRQIQIDKLQKAIEEQQALSQEMQKDLAAEQNIGAIEEYARANLGMEYGDRASVTYVDLPDTRPPVEYAYEKQKGEGLFAMLLRLLD
jgi:cell division protein FtsL